MLLTSLIEAADRVDSTCGLQMAYVKKWAPRSYNDLELREPDRRGRPGGSVSRIDANELAPRTATSTASTSTRPTTSTPTSPTTTSGRR